MDESLLGEKEWCRVYYIILKNLKESFCPLPFYASLDLRTMNGFIHVDKTYMEGCLKEFLFGI